MKRERLLVIAVLSVTLVASAAISTSLVFQGPDAADQVLAASSPSSHAEELNPQRLEELFADSSISDLRRVGDVYVGPLADLHSLSECLKDFLPSTAEIQTFVTFGDRRTGLVEVTLRRWNSPTAPEVGERLKSAPAICKGSSELRHGTALPDYAMVPSSRYVTKSSVTYRGSVDGLPELELVSLSNGWTLIAKYVSSRMANRVLEELTPLLDERLGTTFRNSAAHEVKPSAGSDWDAVPDLGCVGDMAVQTDAVKFVDLTGDGVLDVVAAVSCVATTSSNPVSVVVLDGAVPMSDPSGVHVLVPPTADPFPIHEVSLLASDRSVRVSAEGRGNQDAPVFGPTVRMQLDFAWDGKEFVEQEKLVQPIR